MNKIYLYLIPSFILLIMIIIPSCAKAIEVELYDGKIIKLLDVVLPEEKKVLMGNPISYGPMSSDIKPIAKDLGMSNVPVLDQGQEGTCLTFAATAAIDARLGIGDFISQQCSLQLNKNLGTDGWNGLYYASEVIDPLKKYGVVSQSGCNARYPSKSVPISVSEYQSRSDKSVSEKVSALKYTYYSQPSLSILKSAIDQGKRVEISFLLNPNSQDGVKGYDITVNGVKKYGGLWACSNPNINPQPDPDLSELEQCKLRFPDFEWYCDWLYGKNLAKLKFAGENCGQFNSGHGVIAVGYDDTQKLIKIRNSWGVNVGDSGEYFMSYEFFSSQVMDMTVF